MARQTYTREFKLPAVRLMTADGLAVAEVARRLGVGANGRRPWRDLARQPGEAAFPGPGNLSAEPEAWRRLRAEVHRLPAERDLLKKAAASFASPPSGRSASSGSSVATARWPGRATPWRCPSPATTPGPPARPPRPRCGVTAGWRRSRRSTPRSRGAPAARGWPPR
jgi:transposase